MSDRLDELDYFTLLGVDPGVSGDKLREAFHRFAMKYHPDNHVGTKNEARAAAIFRRGTEAYRVLRDPAQQARYREGLEQGSTRLRGNEVKKKVAEPMDRRARPFFIKAEKAFKAGDMAQAKLNIGIALGHQPDHPSLLALKKQLA